MIIIPVIRGILDHFVTRPMSIPERFFFLLSFTSGNKWIVWSMFVYIFNSIHIGYTGNESTSKNGTSGIIQSSLSYSTTRSKARLNNSEVPLEGNFDSFLLFYSLLRSVFIFLEKFNTRKIFTHWLSAKFNTLESFISQGNKK